MKWIKHDTDAHRDVKLKRLVMAYGLEGYGLYWYCLEEIARDISPTKYTFELEHDAEIIAFSTGMSTEKVETIMKKMIVLGLFESSGGIITCLKMATRLDQSMTSNPQMRQIISNVKKQGLIENSHDSIMMKSANDHDEVSPDKIRLDKTRLDKKKKAKKPLITFQVFLKNIKASGEKSIHEEDPIFEYAQKAGIEPIFLELAWDAFKAKYDGDEKKYTDWRAVFRKSVRGNWLKLWWVNEAGKCELTSLGRQAERYHKSEAA